MHMHFKTTPHPANRVWGALLLLLVTLTPAFAATGPVSAVQEALKREQCYFGEPTGELDESTRKALRDFQSREGLPVTAEIDTATLQALEKASEGSRPSRNSNPVVIQSLPAKSAPSEAPAAVAETDRAFLQSLQQPDTAPSAAQTAALSPAPAAENVIAPPLEAAVPPPIVAAATPVIATTAPAEATPPPKARSQAIPIRRAKPVERLADEAMPARQRAVSNPEDEQRPVRRKVSRIPPAETYQDPMEPNGVRIMRPPTRVDRTETGAETRISRSTKPVVTSSTEVRTAEPAEPPRRKGFFDRLFNDNDDDDDDGDDD